MRLGFIIPDFPNEKRVALLPEHISGFNNELIIEKGFGASLGISDDEYIRAGCTTACRREIFKNCEAVFSLKLIQPQDYHLLENGQTIIGWTHPFGSGKDFMQKQAKIKDLIIVDLDNINPCIYYKDYKIPVNWIKRNFVAYNSFIAGMASTYHAILSYGIIPDSNIRAAVLSPGNVAQGAYTAITEMGASVRLFYRKTMAEFKENLGKFDIIINGIEVDRPDLHILSLEDQEKLKENCLVIDAAADAGNAIEGSRYTSLDKPIYKRGKVYYYVVNNSPSIFYRSASRIISETFSKHVYCKDVRVYKEMITGLRKFKEKEMMNN